MNKQRSPIRRKWMNLAVEHHNAAVKKDEIKRMKIFLEMEAIEVEFPKEIEAERAMWKGESKDG